MVDKPKQAGRFLRLNKVLSIGVLQETALNLLYVAEKPLCDSYHKVRTMYLMRSEMGIVSVLMCDKHICLNGAMNAPWTRFSHNRS